jgi:hypothetical protein
LQPGGQQPSPYRHFSITSCLQERSQVSALPTIVSEVHAFPSSQLVGHELLGSQLSPGSMTPLPHVALHALPSAERHGPELPFGILSLSNFAISWQPVADISSKATRSNTYGLFITPLNASD